MVTLFHIFTLVIFGIVMLLGTTTNIFIITVISIDGMRSRGLSACDLILLSQALTNVVIEWFSSVERLFSLVLRDIFIQEGFQKFLFVFYPVCVFSNFWITALLCVFYCATIASFTHPLFMRLKLAISWMVPWLLLGILLASVAISVPVIWNMEEPSLGNSTKEAFLKEGTRYSYSHFYKIFMECLGFTSPLAIILVSAVVILVSLCKHMRRMQRNSTGSSMPSMDAHVGAAKIIVLLLVIYVFFYIALNLTITDTDGYRESGVLYVHKYITQLYPLMHALILIMGNPKLKAAARKIQCHCRH